MKKRHFKVNQMSIEQIKIRMKRMKQPFVKHDQSGDQTRSQHYKHLVQRLAQLENRNG